MTVPVVVLHFIQGTPMSAWSCPIIKNSFMKKIGIVFFLLGVLFSSCDKDKDKGRTIRYELSGVYTGTLIASYTTASGGTVNEPVTAIPWNKSVTYAANVTGAVFALSGNGGIPGQKITILVKRGSTTLSTTVAEADAAGSFSKPTPTVIL